MRDVKTKRRPYKRQSLVKKKINGGLMVSFCSSKRNAKTLLCNWKPPTGNACRMFTRRLATVGVCLKTETKELFLGEETFGLSGGETKH